MKMLSIEALTRAIAEANEAAEQLQKVVYLTKRDFPPAKTISGNLTICVNADIVRAGLIQSALEHLNKAVAEIS